MEEAKNILKKNIDLFIDDYRIIPSEGRNFFFRCYQASEIIKKYTNKSNTSSYFRNRIKTIDKMIWESCKQIVEYSLKSLEHIEKEEIFSKEMLKKINQSYASSQEKENIRFLYETWRDSSNLLIGSRNFFTTSILTKKKDVEEQIIVDIKWVGDIHTNRKKLVLPNQVSKFFLVMVKQVSLGEH